MPVKMEDEREDEEQAFNDARLYHAELDEVYRYFMPYRQATSQRSSETGGQSEGQSRTDHLFDGTGLSAAFNFAGMMSADWMPPFQDFFKLEAGPLIPREDRAELNRQLADITEMANGVLPKIRLVAQEVFTDLFGGTGAMFTTAGNARNPVRGQAAPIHELAIRDDAFGEPNNVWWRRNYKPRQIEEAWPKGKFSDDLRERMKQKKSDIRITQSVRYDPGADVFLLRVYAESDDVGHVIFEEEYRTNPWQIVRFFKVPGESYGRGLAHLGLPGIKTTNKTRELALRAAAFALMGIWMRRNDGVFNPDTAEFKPLRFWTVASTGGPLGATLQRLPVPENFDVASIVMKDERDQLNKILLNDDMPDLQDSVRSPTEIAARLRRMAKSRGGVGARISLELVGALAQRTVDILEKQGLLATRLTIDQLLTKTTVTAPAAAAQRADKVQWAVDWMQMIMGLMGPQALPAFVKVQDLLPDIGRWMGVDERYVPTAEEVKEFQNVVAGIAAQMQASQAKGAAPEAPGAAYVNGGAV